MLIHVVAFNKEGMAIDNYKNLGGVTGHMTLGTDYSLSYTGSKIDNWSIIPIYSDKLGSAYNGTTPAP